MKDFNLPKYRLRGQATSSSSRRDEVPLPPDSCFAPGGSGPPLYRQDENEEHHWRQRTIAGSIPGNLAFFLRELPETMELGRQFANK